MARISHLTIEMYYIQAIYIDKKMCQVITQARQRSSHQKLAIRILFATIVIRIYVLAWSCKKDRNVGASGRKAARSFSSKLIWIIKHNMNDFYI